MNNPLVVSIATLLIAAGPAIAMTEAACSRTWVQIDVDKSGDASKSEAPNFHAALQVSKKLSTGEKLTKSLFLQYCADGHFDHIKAEGRFSGANAGSSSKDAREIVKEIVDNAKMAPDGTMQPSTGRAKPVENWFGCKPGKSQSSCDEGKQSTSNN